MITFLFLFSAFSMDCSRVEPFKIIGTQKTKVTVMKMYWANGSQKEEKVCEGNTLVTAYDIRNRELEAFECLKPNPVEVKTCRTKLNGKDAQVQVVPSTLIRNWIPQAKREYRFHSYVVNESDPAQYYDIFSRTLTEALSSQAMIVEGAFRTGPKDAKDGYHVRIEFL